MFVKSIIAKSQRLMLSKKAKYALKALITLARQTDGQSMGIGEMAEEDNIPRKFLEAILFGFEKPGCFVQQTWQSGWLCLAQKPWRYFYWAGYPYY